MATAGPSRLPPPPTSCFEPASAVAPFAGPSSLPATSSASRGNRGPDLWTPSRYLEPNHPDNEEVLEQAAYQAAVTKHGGDNRKSRYKPRKTVDYQGGVIKWRQLTKVKGVGVMGKGLPVVHPNPSDLIGVLPPAAHPLNPSTSILDQFIHTSINKERSPTRVVAWTPDCRRLLTGNDKGQFTLWNGASFNYESITQVHDDSLRAMAWSHNGQALISADKLGVIKYFTPHLTNVNQLQGHREACHSISWSPNDERFVSGGDDGLVKVWSYREAKEEKALSGHGWDVRCVDWHPTKGLIASGSRDMLVKFWDPRTGKELSTLHTHKSTINTCKWSPSGHLVATAGGDGAIKLFDIRTFRELDVLKGHTKEINCLEWHPIHPQIFSSGDAAGAILHWSLLAPDPSLPVTTLSAAHDDAVFSLSYHPLGHILCSGSKDFTARFWCRPRPMGGHEKDRWHLGEREAMGAKMEEEQGRKWKMGPVTSGNDAMETKEGLPGLPGLSGSGLPGLPGLGYGNGMKAEMNGSTSPTFSGRQGMSGNALPGLPGLPGLGNAPNAGAGSTATRQWGQDHSGSGAAFGRVGAPLPSQADMLRQNNQAPPPSRFGNDTPQGSRGYGRNEGSRDMPERGGPSYGGTGGGGNRYGNVPQAASNPPPAGYGYDQPNSNAYPGARGPSQGGQSGSGGYGPTGGGYREGMGQNGRDGWNQYGQGPPPGQAPSYSASGASQGRGPAGGPGYGGYLPPQQQEYGGGYR